MTAPTTSMNKGMTIGGFRSERKVVEETKTPGRYMFAGARIVIGFIFLWAFIDKLFGLGYSTKSANSWLNGGSPTNGFLSHSASWLQGFYHAIAGNVFTDWLFMIGLLCIGVALMTGVGVRIAAYTGALLLVMMYGAGTLGVPGTTNPIVDDHIVYALVLLGLAAVHSGRTLGLGKYWSNTKLVQKYPVLE